MEIMAQTCLIGLFCLLRRVGGVSQDRRGRGESGDCARARKAVAEAFRNEIKTDARLSQGRTPDSRQSSIKRLNCAE